MTTTFHDVAHWLNAIDALAVRDEFKTHLSRLPLDDERTMRLAALRGRVMSAKSSDVAELVTLLGHIEALMGCIDFDDSPNIMMFFRRSILTPSTHLPAHRFPPHALGTSMRIKEAPLHTWLRQRLLMWLSQAPDTMHRIALDEILRIAIHFEHRAASIRPVLYDWLDTFKEDPAITWTLLLALAEIQCAANPDPQTTTALRHGLTGETLGIRLLSACYLLLFNDRSNDLAQAMLLEHVVSQQDANTMNTMAAPLPWRALLLDMVNRNEPEQVVVMTNTLHTAAQNNELWTMDMALTPLLLRYHQLGETPDILLSFILKNVEFLCGCCDALSDLHGHETLTLDDLKLELTHYFDYNA